MDKNKKKYLNYKNEKSNTHYNNNNHDNNDIKGNLIKK